MKLRKNVRKNIVHLDFVLGRGWWLFQSRTYTVHTWVLKQLLVHLRHLCDHFSGHKLIHWPYGNNTQIIMLFTWDNFKAQNYCIDNNNINTTTPKDEIKTTTNRNIDQLTLNHNRVESVSFLLKVPYQAFTGYATTQYVCPCNLELFTATVLVGILLTFRTHIHE